MPFFLFLKAFVLFDLDNWSLISFFWDENQHIPAKEKGMIILTSEVHNTFLWEQHICVRDVFVLKLQNDISDLIFWSTLGITTLVCIFSIQISINFLRWWQGEFLSQSDGDHFLHSHYLNVWFRGACDSGVRVIQGWVWFRGDILIRC